MIVRTFFAVAWVIAIPAVAHAFDGVPPETKMESLTQGFTLELTGDLNIPVNSHGQSAMVLQAGHLYEGIWAWRGDRFYVLRNINDPSSDVLLDPALPSCQIGIDQAVSPLPSKFGFRQLTYQGQIHDRVSFYAATGENDSVFMSCLTGMSASTSQTPFFARDFGLIWGAALEGIEAE